MVTYIRAPTTNMYKEQSSIQELSNFVNLALVRSVKKSVQEKTEPNRFQTSLNGLVLKPTLRTIFKNNLVLKWFKNQFETELVLKLV